MKILFDGVDFSSPYRTGPTVFARRLALQFLSMGHVIADTDDYDVVLTFIEPSFRGYDRPIVQRLDGIWFKNEDEFINKNAGIRRCYSTADHVIFQSNFDKSMIVHHWGDSRAHSVINNGIIIDPLKDHSKLSPEILRIRTTYDRVYCCSANWHGQKRLEANVELFRHLKQFDGKSCLIVMGSNPQQISGNDIFYTGNVPHEISNQIYAISDWMFHLAYLDHSPNSVVEALMQGTPVVCSSSGGTKELVGNYGIIVNEIEEYDYRLIDYERPPELDLSGVGPLPDVSSLGQHADIDLRNVANRYVDVLRNVLQ